MADTKANPPGTQAGFGPGHPTRDRGGEKSYFTEGLDIADVAGTADATYSTNEVDMINDLKTAVNAILAEFRRREWIH